MVGRHGNQRNLLAMGLSHHLMQIMCDDGKDEGESEEVVAINYNVEKDAWIGGVCVCVCVKEGGRECEC